MQKGNNVKNLALKQPEDITTIANKIGFNCFQLNLTSSAFLGRLIFGLNIPLKQCFVGFFPQLIQEDIIIRHVDSKYQENNKNDLQVALNHLTLSLYLYLYVYLKDICVLNIFRLKQVFQ